jgi:hypothetical protein
VSCDDRRFYVQVDQPYIYEVWAVDEEDARRKGIDCWRRREPAQVGAFPSDVTVTEVTTANGAE